MGMRDEAKHASARVHKGTGKRDRMRKSVEGWEAFLIIFPHSLFGSYSMAFTQNTKHAVFVKDIVIDCSIVKIMRLLSIR